ncbi:hypothetical protein HPB50_008222 [Hyalomma asiaticum]|uniref:Uncharacterized protein n=1 Tax=Hyalomma asiaticum TaxID=266040 RepID=A0ACB7SCP2_HYAAI|nr:hypothetical protein HPB50_008222 [Hyalomma asiaticum]
MMAGVFDLELHDAENDKNDESSDDAIEVDEQVGGSGTWYRIAVTAWSSATTQPGSLPMLREACTRLHIATVWQGGRVGKASLLH